MSKKGLTPDLEAFLARLNSNQTEAIEALKKLLAHRKVDYATGNDWRGACQVTFQAAGLVAKGAVVEIKLVGWGGVLFSAYRPVE